MPFVDFLQISWGGGEGSIATAAMDTSNSKNIPPTELIRVKSRINALIVKRVFTLIKEKHLIKANFSFIYIHLTDLP